jgi:hypothetical protein
MKKAIAIMAAGILVAGLTAGCKKGPEPPKDIQAFAVDSAQGVLNPEVAVFDKSVSADGNGSLKVSTEMPTTVALYEVSFPGVEGADLVYRAKVKTQDFGGDAYLQMQVHFPAGGEVTAQNYQNALHGTSDWKTLETSLRLQKGQKPDSVRLGLVVNGVGTVWIDDIHLIKAPSAQ